MADKIKIKISYFIYFSMIKSELLNKLKYNKCKE